MGIAEIIDKRLAELEISQARLAELLNENPQAIVHWKTRGRIPVNKVGKVAGALRMAVEDLLPGAAPAQERSLGSLDENTKRMLEIWRRMPDKIQRHYLAIMEYSPAPSAEVENKLPARRRTKKAG